MSLSALQVLHLLLIRLCWQMLDPLHSFYLLLTRLCCRCSPLRNPCKCSLAACAGRCCSLRTPSTGSFSECAGRCSPLRILCIDSFADCAHIVPPCPLVLDCPFLCYSPRLRLAPPASRCPLHASHSRPQSPGQHLLHAQAPCPCRCSAATGICSPSPCIPPQHICRDNAAADRGVFLPGPVPRQRGHLCCPFPPSLQISQINDVALRRVPGPRALERRRAPRRLGAVRTCASRLDRGSCQLSSRSVSSPGVALSRALLCQHLRLGQTRPTCRNS